MEPKEIGKKLMNLPREHREWLIKNVAPATFARWCRQNSVALRPYKTLGEKIAAFVSGRDKLSDLAIFEKNGPEPYSFFINPIIKENFLYTSVLGLYSN